MILKYLTTITSEIVSFSDPIIDVILEKRGISQDKKRKLVLISEGECTKVYMITERFV
jgi:hypothetical protein